MNTWKRLTAGLLALVSALIFTFHITASAQAVTLGEAIDFGTKYGPKLLELKAGYDQLAPLFKSGAWDRIDEALPGLNKGFVSILGTLAKKAPPELQESLGPLAATVTSYLDGFNEAQTSYKTAKSTYKKAESTYKKEVESDFDKIDDGLEALLKFLPKAPKAPKA
jgi:hypothetical protein